MTERDLQNMIYYFEYLPEKEKRKQRKRKMRNE